MRGGASKELLAAGGAEGDGSVSVGSAGSELSGAGLEETAVGAELESLLLLALYVTVAEDDGDAFGAPVGDEVSVVVADDPGATAVAHLLEEDDAGVRVPFGILCELDPLRLALRRRPAPADASEDVEEDEEGEPHLEGASVGSALRLAEETSIGGAGRGLVEGILRLRHHEALLQPLQSLAAVRLEEAQIGEESLSGVDVSLDESLVDEDESVVEEEEKLLVVSESVDDVSASGGDEP